ncbi:hypothetical protein DSCW_53210 [Desulfosarcina widdelii]|uniref:Tetracyclin repressor-like C-terminal domain-containing protein n=2 Tax=Desulfosarcina widdelii TaxID=947919 RepID=A0A5K7ZHV6_9BACT|nr:hypothetical protein DSCW_53210 [Desulfosarcina widdelii]
MKGSMKEDTLADYHPIALADILWGIFSGVVLREEVKKVINGSEGFVNGDFDMAFDIFIRGLQAAQN